MSEEKRTYRLANQLIQNVKEFILLLYDMTKAPEASDGFKNNTILGVSNGYIRELNEEIAPYLKESTEYLVQLVLDEKLDEYKDLNLPANFDEEGMKKYAEFCFGNGYNPRRFDWWAPNEILQDKKYRAISIIESAAKEYIINNNEANFLARL